MQWLIANSQYIFALLFALSELLAQIPSVKSNSIFQLVVGAIKQISGKA